MKNIFLVVVVSTLIPLFAHGNTVYLSDSSYSADIKVYVTDQPYSADKESRYIL